MGDITLKFEPGLVCSEIESWNGNSKSTLFNCEEDTTSSSLVYQSQSLPAINYNSPPTHLASARGNLLFREPFFIQTKADSGDMLSTSAKCLSCTTKEVVIKGQKSVTSNFIKHLKRMHPEKYELYKNHKTGKRLRRFSNGVIECGNLPVVPGKSSLSGVANLCQLLPEEFKELPNTDTPEDMDVPTSEGIRLVTPNRLLKHGAHLSENALRSIGSLVEEKIKEKQSTFASNDNFDSLQKQISDLRSECDLLRAALRGGTGNEQDIATLRAECNNLKALISSSNKNEQRLRNQIDEVECFTRRKNIILKNIIAANQTESPMEIVQKILTNIMGVSDIRINYANVVGELKSGGQTRQCLLAEVSRPQDVRTIFHNAHKLRNTGIVLENHLTKQTRAKKFKMLALRKEIFRRKPDANLKIRNAILRLDGEEYYWDDRQGLCCTASDNALNELKLSTGSDFGHFIDILKNYWIR